MQLSFILNAILSSLVVIVPVVVNLVKARGHIIHARLALLGLSIVSSICFFSLLFLGLVSPSFTVKLLLASSCWFMALLYISFLMEMTAAKRPSWFPWAYPLQVVFGVVCAIIADSRIVMVMAGAGLLVYSYLSLSFIISWIRAATDERARRDGEWILLVFTAFGLGLVVCLFHVLTGVFWLLALWFLVLHIAVNYLKLLQQLSDPENSLIIDNVFDIVIILDSEGRIVRMNRRGFHLSSFSAGSVNGYGIEKLIVHAELDARRRQGWLEKYGWIDKGRIIATGWTRSPSIDAFFVTKQEEAIPVDLRILCMSGLRKERTGYIVSATDMRITHQLMKEISDREYATRDLALSESKFSRMFIFNPTGIIIADLDTLRITEVNPAIEEIFECDSSMLAGKSLSAIGFEMTDSTFQGFIEKVQMEGSVPEFSAKIRLGTQNVRNCRLSAVTFDFNKTRYMLLSVADVTQQEQMREALNRKQKVETVGILAGGIAHDFNNILAVILGHVGLAKMRITDEHARLPILKAEEACLRARDMTRQLLAFSRGGKPVIGRCETRQLIIDSAMLAVSDTSVACLFDIAKDVWPLRADRIQIGQVVTNLVKNSVDVMDKGGIIEIKVQNCDFRSVSFRKRPSGTDSKPLPNGRYVEIVIADQGPGIPESIREKIFDPFFTTKEKGTGLGLSIVFSIVQNHAGAINVESREGDGAVFSIFIPADIDSAKGESDPDLLSLSGKKKVLLMDDDILVQETARGILQSFGYDVAAAFNGEDAIRLYKEALDSGLPFDFCILDLVVPGGMSGVDCAQALRKINPGVLLLVSSGYSDDPVLARYQEYGFRGIIAKPYTVEEFRQSLANVLVF